MTLDELDTEWRAANEAAATSEQRERLIAATHRRVNRLWARIFRRDLRETIAAVFVALFFGRYVIGTNLVVSMSAAWLVLWALKVIYKMHRARTIRMPAPPDAPVREFCRIELDRLSHQIRLLRSMLWWYIAPCMIGVNAFFIGHTGFGIASVVYGVATLLLGWWLYALNRRAVAMELEPARTELANLLNQLDDTTASPSSLAGAVSLERIGNDPLAAARATVLAAKSVALVSLLLGLIVACGGVLGALDGYRSAYVIYCIVTVLVAWTIYRARPVSVELAAREGPAAAKYAAFTFTVLVVVIALLTVFTVLALASGAFDTGYVIYCIVTLLLAWGIYRARSYARTSVMFLLEALAFLALAGGLFHSSYDGAPRSDGPGGAALADLVTDLRKKHQLVGLAAMVMVDGKVMASAADGERKIRSGVPLELGDRWHLGSITKSITATMIARLVESGQMKWSDTVGARFADASIHEEWKPVTLQQLLTHTAGAPANFSKWVMLKYPEFNLEWTKERRKAVLEVLAKKPAYPPGEKHVYSNVGYTIAGAIAESATGVGWEDLVKREVFAPLGLTEAGFGPPKSPSATLDQPRGHDVLYGWKLSAADDDDNTPIIGPAGIVHMTLGNLCNYATEHLRGELGAGKLLTEETYKRLHKPALHNYACGWVVKQPTNDIPYTVYWHNGSNTMWYALVVFIPGKNLVVAVTSNDGDIKPAESAAWKIVNACANRFNVEGDAARRQSLPPDKASPKK